MASTNDSQAPVYVTVSALDAGHLTLPEKLFVTDADPDKRATVPSLSFLIQHPSSNGGTTKLVFDLGVKRDLKGYAPAQQAHIAARQPIITEPDCTGSIRQGGLDPAKDIDIVILSHVHWDHVGTPQDFSGAVFVVGSGTMDLLKNGAGLLYPAALFNDDEVPPSSAVEFPAVPNHGDDMSEYNAGARALKHWEPSAEAKAKLGAVADSWSWKPLASFPNALDFFGDGSLYVIDSPGHLYGHVNLLARIAADKYVYLGGDCCHDPRILQGEKGIAMYDDGRGGTRSVHVHTGMAKRTLELIDGFVKEKRTAGSVQVEVVVAHDKIWRESNKDRFWPGRL
jgi:glyoxylase-like metal-dependent hydrolase (beta-lactamase superfamily II)